MTGTELHSAANVKLRLRTSACPACIEPVITFIASKVRRLWIPLRACRLARCASVRGHARREREAADWVHPIPEAAAGSISHIMRTSPGAALGYLSLPRYFFASESMCVPAPSSETRRTRPRIWI